MIIIINIIIIIIIIIILTIILPKHDFVGNCKSGGVCIYWSFLGKHV
jgi:hypothetical protein